MVNHEVVLLSMLILSVCLSVLHFKRDLNHKLIVSKINLILSVFYSIFLFVLIFQESIRISFKISKSRQISKQKLE